MDKYCIKNSPKWILDFTADYTSQSGAIDNQWGFFGPVWGYLFGVNGTGNVKILANSSQVGVSLALHNFTVNCNSNSSISITVDNSTTTGNPSYSASYNADYYLFACNGTYSPTGSYPRIASMNIFRCTMRDSSNNIVRDFIPCVLEKTATDYWGNSQEKGAVGMWDLISDKFFPNNGTGSFAIIGGYNVPTDGLIAEYLFNDNVSDTSGNGNNLTNSGITFASSGLTGIVKAGVFNGTSSNANTSATAFDNFKTVSVWANWDASTTGTILTLGGQGSSPADPNGLFDMMYFDGKLHVQYRISTGGAKAGVEFDWDFGSWHHLAIVSKGRLNTLQSSDFKVYVDGIEITPTGMTPMTGNYGTIVTRSVLGAYFTTNNAYRLFYKGKMAAVRIYDRELTASEVTMLYNEGAL